ncbi:MAG: hypothetical protein LBB72_07205 [Spirochaetaceae bacterium]|jgi:hypothetical protein|nr:hypothetical protein [Spirochaetaceae bacterium]
MKKSIVFLLLFFPVCLWSFDFGVDLNQDAVFGGIGDDTEAEYSAALIPHFAVSLGESADLYVSAALEAIYEYEEFSFAAELLHTELSWRSGNLKIRAGRIPYADPLGFTVEGFFDGAQVLYDTTAGTFNAGGWYTGLLYKRNANITMTGDDFVSYYTALDYDNFSDTYFASRRMLMAVGWEHPAIAEMIRARASVLGQYDLNDTDNPYHSIYISAKAAIPVKQFIIALGGCMQMAKAGDKTGVGLAGELGGAWIVPTHFYSQLSLIGRFSSGKTDSIDPFIPITTKPQGSVLEAKLSGLSAFFLDYAAQLRPTVYAGLTASYFIRSDKETYTAYPVNPVDNDGSVLGGEFFGRVTWSPLTDLSLNFGAGIFLPSMGNINPKADFQWRVELALMLVVF